MGSNFTGKVVIVTGSTSGIGKDAAIGFARAGAQVVVTGRDEGRAAVVAAMCKEVSPTGLAPLVIIADLSKEEDCIKIIEQTIGKYKQLDVLVNNAGMGTPAKFSSDDFMEAFDTIIRTNVRAVVQLTRLATPHLAKNGGVIVNVTSVAARKVTQQSLHTPYAMSKAAVEMLTKCACVEFGPSGIRVVTVCPGAIETPMLDKAGLTVDFVREVVGPTLPRGRIGKVADTTAAILFVASEDAGFISGSSIDVDGGYLAGELRHVTISDKLN